MSISVHGKSYRYTETGVGIPIYILVHFPNLSVYRWIISVYRWSISVYQYMISVHVFLSVYRYLSVCKCGNYMVNIGIPINQRYTDICIGIPIWEFRYTDDRFRYTDIGHRYAETKSQFRVKAKLKKFRSARQRIRLRDQTWPTVNLTFPQREGMRERFRPLE